MMVEKPICRKRKPKRVTVHFTFAFDFYVCDICSVIFMIPSIPVKVRVESFSPIKKW